MKKIFALDKGMTQAISHFSRHQDAVVEPRDGRYVYFGKDRKDALSKIRLFYRVAIGTLIVAGVLLFASTGNFGHSGQASNAANSTATGKAPTHAQ